MAISKEQPMRTALNDCIDVINALMESVNITNMEVLRTLRETNKNENEQEFLEEE